MFIPICIICLDEKFNIMSVSGVFSNWVKDIYEKYNFYDHLFLKNINQVFYKIDIEKLEKGVFCTLCLDDLRIYVKIFKMSNIIYIDFNYHKIIDISFFTYSVRSPLYNTIELISLISDVKNDKKFKEYLEIIKNNNYCLVKSINDVTDMLKYFYKGIVVSNDTIYVKKCIENVKKTIKNLNVIDLDIKMTDTIINDDKYFGNFIYHLLNYCNLCCKENTNIDVKFIDKKLIIKFVPKVSSEKHLLVIKHNEINNYDYILGIDINLAKILSHLLKIELNKIDDYYQVIL